MQRFSRQTIVQVLMITIVAVAGIALSFVASHSNVLLLVIAGVGAVVAAFVLRSPFTGLLLLTFFLPFERIGAYETSAGTIRLSQLFLLVTLLAWVLALLQRKLLSRKNPLLVPMLCFFAVNVLGLTQAPNLHYSLEVLLLIAFTMCASLVVPQLVTSSAKAERIVRILLLSALLVSMFGVFQFLGDLVGLPSSVTGLRELYTKTVFGFPRIQSTALEPLYFANYLLIPLSVTFALFLYRKSAFPSWMLFGMLVLFGADLLLTVSRGGYAAMAVSLFIITLLSLREFFRPRVIVPVVVGVVFVLFAVTKFLSVGDTARLNLDVFTQHIRDVFSGPSYQERVDTIDRAQSAFWHSPWIGIGPGSFGPFVANDPSLKPDSGWLIVNNEPLELLAETGVLGFLSILTLVFLLVLRSIRALRKAAGQQSTLAAIHLGLFGAMLGVIVQYQTFSVLYIMHIWFLVGLLTAVQTLLLHPENHD